MDRLKEMKTRLEELTGSWLYTKDELKVLEAHFGRRIHFAYPGWVAFLEGEDRYQRHYKPLLERLAEECVMATDVRRFFTDDMLSAFSEPETDDPSDPATTCPADDPAQEVYAEYSPAMRKAVAYINEQLEPEDKAIIAAQVNKNFKQHMNPAYGIDDDKIIDLLEEYGDDHDLGEGWWEEEYDLDDIVLLINFEN